ncbi:MAG: DUF6175 family protein, partial [Treponemataceae bacterium]|nr:DUF6175 family protein [Treponemataceae bacterium]
MYKKMLWIGAGLLLAGVLSCASAPETPIQSGESTPSGGGSTASSKSEARQRAESLITGERPASGSGSAQSNAQAAATNGGTTAQGGTSTGLTTQDTGPVEPPAELTPKEKQFFENYLKRLKYLMVMKEGAAVTEFQRRSILTKGNEFLLKQGYDVVQYDQLMKNMQDQRAAYEAEAGVSMSLVQYIAQKLGADVYVELDCSPRSFTENNRHYGEANFTATIYDPSTAELLGSVTYRTDRSVSTSSQEDALLNALTAGTAQLMGRVVRD